MISFTYRVLSETYHALLNETRYSRETIKENIEPITIAICTLTLVGFLTRKFFYNEIPPIGRIRMSSPQINVIREVNQELGKIWKFSEIQAKLNCQDPRLQEDCFYRLILKVADTYQDVVFDQISVLNLQEREFTKKELANLIKLCPNVKHLILTNCKCLTDEMVELLVSTYKELKSINLHGCIVISSRTISFIAENWKGLDYINLAICDNTTDDNIATFAKNSPELRSIDLYFCSKITTQSLTALSQCKYLEAIDLSYCDELKEPDILHFIKVCSSLKKVKIDSIENLQGEFLHEIKAIRPNIEVSL